MDREAVLWNDNLLPEIPFAVRIRLSEGFHFAASGDGIVNMVIELPIKVKKFFVCI